MFYGDAKKSLDELLPLIADGSHTGKDIMDASTARTATPTSLDQSLRRMTDRTPLAALWRSGWCFERSPGPLAPCLTRERHQKSLDNLLTRLLERPAVRKIDGSLPIPLSFSISGTYQSAHCAHRARPPLDLAAGRATSLRMATIVLFHSILGLRPAESAIAARFTAAGHEVALPDLYDGRRADSLRRRLRAPRRIGDAELPPAPPRRRAPAGRRRARRRLDGRRPRRRARARRPETRGVLLLHGPRRGSPAPVSGAPFSPVPVISATSPSPSLATSPRRSSDRRRFRSARRAAAPAAAAGRVKRRRPPRRRPSAARARRHMVDLRVAEQPVERPFADRVGQAELVSLVRTMTPTSLSGSVPR